MGRGRFLFWIFDVRLLASLGTRFPIARCRANVISEDVISGLERQLPNPKSSSERSEKPDIENRKSPHA
jgi:hypothetical protein